jgi:hypothetical protein
LPRIAKIRDYHPQITVRGGIDELKEVDNIVIGRGALDDERIAVEFFYNTQVQFSVGKLLEFNYG